MKITQTRAAVGAEIEGIDLRTRSDDALPGVRNVLAECGVVFFRNPRHAPGEPVAFAERKGEIDVDRFFRSTWHLAPNDDHGHRRFLHRITLEGGPLEAAHAAA
ncbi:MAG: hypothetical protein AAGC67_13500 [Myxococcota bacterium]